MSGRVAANIFLAVVLIGVVLGASYLGYVGVRSVYNSFRAYVARLAGTSAQPVQTGNGASCWTTSNQGLELRATLGFGQYNTSALMIVDTGAYISAAPLELATALSIDPTSGTPVSLGSVYGQSEAGYIHTVNLTLPGMKTVQIPIAIMLSNSVPYVLGRQGFLDHFNLQVQQSSGTFCLTQH